MPWEMKRVNDSQAVPGQWLYTKSGIVHRFKSMLTVAPDNRVGTWVVVNRAGSVGDELAKEINNIIYPAMNQLLVAQPLPVPPRASEFVTQAYPAHVRNINGSRRIVCPYIFFFGN